MLSRVANRGQRKCAENLQILQTGECVSLGQETPHFIHTFELKCETLSHGQHLMNVVLQGYTICIPKAAQGRNAESC